VGSRRDPTSVVDREGAILVSEEEGVRWRSRAHAAFEHDGRRYEWVPEAVVDRLK
jgi:hypothetical protein